MVKKILIFFGLVTLIFISSCSKKKEATNKITLNIWIMPNSSEAEQRLLEILKPFKDKHPEIDIIVTVIDWYSAWSRMTTAATGGT
jgi:multiple sugar transport system substrate-binding protein